MSDTPAPLPVGTLVRHDSFGLGRILERRGDAYLVGFKSGEPRLVSASYPGMRSAGSNDADIQRLKTAIREVLGDFGWLDDDLELGKRWSGGTLVLTPGKPEIQPKEIPIEVFFRKLIGIRDRLRVLEQKINSHAGLADGEKLDLQGYITRCYGSLTTFNVLFAERGSGFQGTGKE